jgi:hypothetical protein
MKTNQLQGSQALLLVHKQLASCYSTAAQVMDEFSLSKVVQLYLPACSDEQYHHLMQLIRDDVVCIITLRRGTRMLVYCYYLTDHNDAQNMFLYHTYLEEVFANHEGRLTQSYNVRVYEYANYEEGL